MCEDFSEDAKVGEVAWEEHTFFESLGLGLNVGGFLSQLPDFRCGGFG